MTLPQWIAVLGAFSVFSMSAFAEVKLENEIVGKVIKVSGKAWAARSLVDNDKVELHLGSSLHGNDIIITDSDAQLEVVLGKKEVSLFVKHDSTLQIFHTPKKDWLVDLRQGLLLSHIRHYSNTHPDHYQVKTHGAVMAVRGTTFFLHSKPTEPLFLCTCEGEVSINHEMTIKSKHHDAPKLIEDGNQPLSSRLKNVDMGVEHSDSEAAELIKLLQDG